MMTKSVNKTGTKKTTGKVVGKTAGKTAGKAASKKRTLNKRTFNRERTQKSQKSQRKVMKKENKSININVLDENKNGIADGGAEDAPFVATILTLFPEAFPGILGLGVHGRALERKLWRLELVNPRDFAPTPARAVDAPPYGGGAGMVIRADVLGKAIDAVASSPGPLLYLSPCGTPLTQARAMSLARGDGVRLLCGRYEGVDARVLEHFAIEEVSLGDFVLSGGELAAMALLEAVVRLRAGVLGNEESARGESFAQGLLEHAHYTRPLNWRGHSVPEILRGGNHAEIATWRESQAQAITRQRRPDLWKKWQKCQKHRTETQNRNTEQNHKAETRTTNLSKKK